MKAPWLTIMWIYESQIANSLTDMHLFQTHREKMEQLTNIMHKALNR